jgi:riboflavin kinase
MSIVVKGQIVTGIGVGSHFIGLEWVREQILEKLGFDPFLGTLNVRMDEETSRRYNTLLEGREGVPIEPLDERYHRGKCYRSRINDRVDGAIVVPVVPDYPTDLMEIVAPVNLRERLGLLDGGEVTVEILEH